MQVLLMVKDCSLMRMCITADMAAMCMRGLQSRQYRHRRQRARNRTSRPAVMNEVDEPDLALKSSEVPCWYLSPGISVVSVEEETVAGILCS